MNVKLEIMNKNKYINTNNNFMQDVFVSNAWSNLPCIC